MKRLLYTLLFCLSLARLSAADAPAPEAPKPAVTPAPKVDYKDAFLQFALDKAQLYSGKLEETISKGVDLAEKELPETFRQFLVWRAWYHGVRAVCPPLCLVLCVSLFLWQWRKWTTNDRESLETGSVGNVFATILGAIGTFVFFCMTISVAAPNTMDLIQLKFAPRIYVIEQVIDLAKHH